MDIETLEEILNELEEIHADLTSGQAELVSAKNSLERVSELVGEEISNQIKK